MRQLKFRAWDKGAEQMYNWESIKYNFHEHVEHHKIEVMQFTGLHDKNGREIYEGDILHDVNSSNVDGAVRYERGKWLCLHDYDSDLYEDLTSGDWELVVIGNIYEGVTG